MGSIYKRTRKRPIPVNAEIITKRGKTLAQWTGKDGRKHKAPLDEDGSHILAESRTYYIQYFDEHGLKKNENTGTPEVDVARQILQAREKRSTEIKQGIVNPTQEGFAKAAKQPINEHVDDFEQYLKDKGSSTSHVDGTMMHIREAIRWMEADRFPELTRERVTRFLGYLRTAEAKHPKHGKETRSARTVNSYAASLKSFTRWMFDCRRCAVNPLTGIKKLTESNDKRHERRAMAGDEFTKLLEAAYSDPGKVQGIEGPTRAMIYLTAALTGLRRKELASLILADFRLDAPTPTVKIQGAYSKNKMTEEIPLHPAVIEHLRAYFERTQPEEGQPVFPLRSPGGGLRATSKMMKCDLKGAGVKYVNSEGFADFHANRVLFITSLCRSNVGLATAQKLARHSDPKLTSNVYNKVSTEERAEAVNGIGFEAPSGHLSGSTIGSSESPSGSKRAAVNRPIEGYNRQHLTLTDDRDDQESESENPCKTRVTAQKKPAADATDLSTPHRVRTCNLRSVDRRPLFLNGCPANSLGLISSGLVPKMVPSSWKTSVAPEASELLSSLVAVWPTLPVHVQQAILVLIQPWTTLDDSFATLFEEGGVK